MGLRNMLLGTLVVLPPLVYAGDDRSGHGRAKDCDERPRPVLLETGIHIDLAYCGAKLDVATTVGTQDPNSDGKFYIVITHDIRGLAGHSTSQVLVYKPNADWKVPEASLDRMGAFALQQGDLDDPDHTGWVAQKDSRLDQRRQDWLPARQIVMRKPSTGEWVYYRIIRDTHHNLLYVLYHSQKDGEGGAGQENSFFDSFAVDPGAFTVDTGATGLGAHLPQPYPNP